MFNVTLQDNIVLGDVSITNYHGAILFKLEGVGSLLGDDNYAIHFCNIIGFKFNSILIGGLGLGLLPYYIENTLPHVDIDIVENNEKVISAINELNHLKTSNIIYDDFTSYKTDKKYDLILADLWWNRGEKFKRDYPLILDNYLNNLTEAGAVYFPVIDELHQNYIDVT